MRYRVVGVQRCLRCVGTFTALLVLLVSRITEYVLLLDVLFFTVKGFISFNIGVSITTITRIPGVCMMA